MTEQVNAAIDWAVANWETVAIAALVLLQAVNKLTGRWDEGEKHWATRALLVLTELLSVLTSKGWSTNAGPLKLPLTLRSGKRSTIFPPAASLVLMIGGFAIMPALNGCAASSANWRKDADKAIRVAHETAKAGWDTARRILHSQCMEAGKECAADTSESQIIKCPQVQKCRARRSNVQTAYMGVQEMCATASESLDAYDKLAIAYKDTFGSQRPSRDSADGERLLAAKRAEVQERINRAERASIELLRKLSTEGLTDEGR